MRKYHDPVTGIEETLVMVTESVDWLLGGLRGREEVPRPGDRH